MSQVLLSRKRLLQLNLKTNHRRASCPGFPNRKKWFPPTDAVKNGKRDFAEPTTDRTAVKLSRKRGGHIIQRNTECQRLTLE